MKKLVNILDKTLKQITDTAGLVGGVVAIIKDGKVTFTHTYGYADRDAQRPITEDSFFDIASCSKAFTTMLAAQAVDSGDLGWDTPIRTYMPEFTMLDKYVADHITARDLASHRTGFPTHDFMREKVNGDRKNIVMKTANLPMRRGFREKYEYNNHMFIVLGYLLECVAQGKLWEQQVLDNIANPLGIEMRFRAPIVDMTGLDCALPYSSDGFSSKRCNYASNNATAPCGGIKTNIKGLCKWVAAMSCGGEYADGKRLCSKEQFSELISPVIPCGENLDWREEGGTSYALAWKNSLYNGKTVIHHSGGLTGFNTQVGFLPSENCGFAMIFNTGSTPAPTVIRALVLDYLTTGECKDDYTFMIDAWTKKRDRAAQMLTQNKGGVPVTANTHGQLIGRYWHPSYTDFDVVEKEGSLWFLFGDFKVQLKQEVNGAIRGYTGLLDGMEPEYIELTLCDGGIKLYTFENVEMFFERQ